VDEIARRSRRATPRAAVYVAMRRLEVKGFLRARTERVRESIRRPRRYASVTPAGLAALRASRRAMNRMWAGLESLILES
jgi:DNA-binding PadR family transcriptional regulator